MFSCFQCPSLLRKYNFHVAYIFPSQFYDSKLFYFKNCPVRQQQCHSALVVSFHTSCRHHLQPTVIVNSSFPAWLSLQRIQSNIKDTVKNNRCTIIPSSCIQYGFNNIPIDVKDSVTLKFGNASRQKPCSLMEGDVFHPCRTIYSLENSYSLKSLKNSYLYGFMELMISTVRQMSTSILQKYFVDHARKTNLKSRS